MGIGSGDTMTGFDDFVSLFVGRDPLAIGRHARALETISFHAGRYWPFEAALWDLFGQACGEPVATLLGRRARPRSRPTPRGASCARPSGAPRTLWRCSRRAFGRSRSGSRPSGPTRGSASSRRSATPSATASRSWSTSTSGGGWPATSARGSGPRARARIDRAAARVRRPVGRGAAPGRGPHRDAAAAGADRACASAAARWRARSRSCASRSTADALDVFQPDVVLALGISGARTLAELALRRNRWFTPHTWTNGIGLLANLHVCAGVGGGPYLEFPYDPPGWTPARRDFMLAEPVAIDDARDGPSSRGGRARGAARRGGGGVLRRGPGSGADLKRDAFIDGRFVAAADGRVFEDISPRDGSVVAEVARGSGEDVDLAVAPRGARSTTAPGRSADPRERKRVLLRWAAADRRARRGARAARVGRRRPPDHRRAERRCPGRAQLHRVVRRGHRQGLRRDRADRPGRARADRARAARCGRRGHPVELPADHHRLEARRPRWRRGTRWS